MILAPVDLFTYGISPNKLFDYLAANLPVLTNVPGLTAEIVREAGVGYVCNAGDSEALASSMQRMATEIRSAPGHFENGRSYVQRHFDREVHARQLDELLLGVVAIEH